MPCSSFHIGKCKLYTARWKKCTHTHTHTHTHRGLHNISAIGFSSIQNIRIMRNIILLMASDCCRSGHLASVAGESRPPAAFTQHRRTGPCGHTADLHSTRVSSKRAVSDMADRTHMLHFHSDSLLRWSRAAE